MRRIFKVLAAALAMVMIAGCSGSGSSNKVVIAGLNFTEHDILANALKQYIEANTDLEVELKTGLGASSLSHAAMLSNEAQITAIRYVGTDLTGALNIQEPIRDPEEAYNRVKQGFQDEFDMTYFPPYGFENTYAFAVRRETAEQYGLKTISDLGKVADQMNVGVDTTWMDRAADGYQAFVEWYGFDFNKVTPMDIGLVYKAVADGEVDAVLAYSTDARIAAFDLVILEDDKHFFPPYQGAVVARNDFLAAHPEVKELLEKLEGTISTSEMTEMNYQVDVQGMDPAEVASQFLKRKGLIQ